MLLEVMSLVALAAPWTQQIDTTVPVRAGTRLQLENFNGSTVVRTWDRSSIHIVADGDERSRLEVRNLGTLLTVRTEHRGSPRSVDYQITVPVRTDLKISGVYNDVTVDGVQGGIAVETVNGDIDVTGGDQFVSLKSVEGEVVLRNAKGRIALSSVNESVHVINANGDITVDAVNGDVTLEQITSSSVTATSVNGDMVYDGTIADAGQYSLTTHNGDVDITVPQTANATVEVGTFNGEFEPAFPVPVSRISRNRFTFVLGSGTARVNLESFQGTIRLHRPGESRRGDRGSYRDRDRERQKEREKEKQKHEERE